MAFFIVCGEDEHNVAQTDVINFHTGNTAEKQTAFFSTLIQGSNAPLPPPPLAAGKPILLKVSVLSVCNEVDYKLMWTDDVTVVIPCH
jgi:hypothetical protein